MFHRPVGLDAPITSMAYVYPTQVNICPNDITSAISIIFPCFLTQIVASGETLNNGHLITHDILLSN